MKNSITFIVYAGCCAGRRLSPMPIITSEKMEGDLSYQKTEILNRFESIYHEHSGVDGYRTIKVYLERKNIYLSNLTVHQYMNRELGLTSVVRRKKPDYRKGKAHKVFKNLVHQEFSASAINQKWCTDFTYLFLTDGSKRYNCAIIDLHDRSIVASITDKNITADLAIRTVTKALKVQPDIKVGANTA